jgi:alpha-1,3-mannosyltransferase
MADKKPPIHQQAIVLLLDIANGRHALSKLIPLALFLADALLCGLIIWRIPCTLVLE